MRFAAAMLLTPVILCSAAQAQQITECSEAEELKLTNMIDRMNDPEMYEVKCIAQQEMMKAHGAMTLEDKSSCLAHMQNAMETLAGRTPAGMEPNGECKEQVKLD